MIIKQIISSGSGIGSDSWGGSWSLGTLYKKNRQIAHEGDLFLCLQEHTSSATDEPDVGINAVTYWIKMINNLTADQIAAAAGTGNPSASNKFVTSDDTRLDTTVISGVAGETLVQYDLVYLKEADGKFYRADNNGDDSSVVIGMCVDAGGINSGSVGDIRIRAKVVTNNNWNFTPGEVLYCGSAGAVSNSYAPSTYAQPVGIALGVHQMLFTGIMSFSQSVVELDINPDLMEVNYTPVSYTPEVNPGTTSLSDQLGSHLKGLDTALTAILSRLTAHNI